jgi:hypothetical protein
LVIALEVMLLNLLLGQGFWWQELEVLLESDQGELLLSDLGFEVVGDRCFFILSGSNEECLHHDFGGAVEVELLSHLLPQVAPELVRQEVILPGAVDEGSGFTP